MDVVDGPLKLRAVRIIWAYEMIIIIICEQAKEFIIIIIIPQ